MRIVVQIASRHTAKAWSILVRHSAGTALPNRTFIVSEQAATALRNAGVKFKEITREEGAPAARGAMTGERI
jgi:hypothetical protein